MKMNANCKKPQQKPPPISWPLCLYIQILSSLLNQPTETQSFKNYTGVKTCTKVRPLWQPLKIFIGHKIKSTMKMLPLTEYDNIKEKFFYIDWPKNISSTSCYKVWYNKLLISYTFQSKTTGSLTFCWIYLFCLTVISPVSRIEFLCNVQISIHDLVTFDYPNIPTACYYIILFSTFFSYFVDSDTFTHDDKV